MNMHGRKTLIDLIINLILNSTIHLDYYLREDEINSINGEQHQFTLSLSTTNFRSNLAAVYVLYDLLLLYQRRLRIVS